MDSAFGVRLEGLPRLPFSLHDCDSPVAKLSWSDGPGVVAGDEFWMRDEGDLVSVGWAEWASYEVDVRQDYGVVAVTLQVTPLDAAVAFVFSVLPLLLPAWELEPFHGSAVLTPVGALMVLGPSGAGKSSLAAALEGRGFPLLADDTCALDDNLVLWPGPAAINPRWADALQRPVAEYNEKMIRVPELYAGLPARPAAVVVLDVEQGTDLAVAELSLEGRLQGILANARHGTFLLERRRALQFKVATELARLPLASVRIDPARHGPDEVLHALAPWCERVGIPFASPGPGAFLEGSAR